MVDRVGRSSPFFLWCFCQWTRVSGHLAGGCLDAVVGYALGSLLLFLVVLSGFLFGCFVLMENEIVGHLYSLAHEYFIAT